MSAAGQRVRPKSTRQIPDAPPRAITLQPQLWFLRQIDLEKRRSERSRNSFVLLLLDVGDLLDLQPKALTKVVDALARSTRDTDLVGWYQDGAVLGVVYTEIRGPGETEIAEKLLEKTRTALGPELLAPTAPRIGLSIHLFPQDEVGAEAVSPLGSAFPADADEPHRPSLFALALKRSIDIAGSLFAITLSSPVMLAVAIAVKLSSDGPILFRQQRVGQRGKTFTFLKFRSMKLNNDPSIHEEFMKKFIEANAAAQETKSGERPLFKIPNDPRVTGVGRFIRRTSLDEFPQFFNVLKGEMSLVGPRPPIPYEVNKYNTWHARRYLSVKPGLTGLWQVHGRSRTTFDEMVRLDLQYARTWTIWMDLKILFQTPLAVLRGDGAK